MPKEVEIKARVDDPHRFATRLQAAGFRLLTKRTHEINTLYDIPEFQLRKRGQLLRLRKYGTDWLLTHKAKGKEGRHKTRVERQTKVDDGPQMAAILSALGYSPTFRYEKFRTEWTDRTGHVVLDETPIGKFVEFEGPPRWIDRTARRLGVDRSSYITQTYAGLFFEWKRKSRSEANEMTFRAVRGSKRKS
jgi:adenylate cyclase, class 2